jgi:hypothetical protein
MNADEMYLLGAIDAVMRKSIEAKQRQANLQHMARLRKIGLIADGPSEAIDAELAAEDDRALDMAIAALEAFRKSHQ